MKPLSEKQLAYLAGFLDGDGSINAQLVERVDYRLKFQIRVSITFFQRTDKYWFLLQLKKEIGVGTCRKRKDGVSEYTIVGKQNVQLLLQQLQPYLRLKQPQTTLVLEICQNLAKKQEVDQFLHLCGQVDKLQALNYSKTRKINSEAVRMVLKQDSP